MCEETIIDLESFYAHLSDEPGINMTDKSIVTKGKQLLETLQEDLKREINTTNLTRRAITIVDNVIKMHGG